VGRSKDNLSPTWQYDNYGGSVCVMSDTRHGNGRWKLHGHMIQQPTI